MGVFCGPDVNSRCRGRFQASRIDAEDRRPIRRHYLWLSHNNFRNLDECTMAASLGFVTRPGKTRRKPDKAVEVFSAKNKQSVFFARLASFAV